VADAAPRYSQEYIERRAEGALRAYVPRALRQAHPTPLGDFAECVKRDVGASFRFDQSLGTSSRGERILGICQFEPAFVISIDQSLNEPSEAARFRFTLAHELGHLSLHRKLRLAFESLDATAKAIVDGVTEFQMKRRVLETTRDFLEWQANSYAAALLMPRATYAYELKCQQEDMGITRSGSIHLDDQPSSQADYREIVDRLSATYQTSRSATRIRLSELRLVQDCRKAAAVSQETENPLPNAMSEVLRQLLEKWESPSADNDEPQS
jgi:Zn-dependent peptidase ImmA (M78 family)